MKIQDVSHPYLLPSSATCKPGAHRRTLPSLTKKTKKRFPQTTSVDSEPVTNHCHILLLFLTLTTSPLLFSLSYSLSFSSGSAFQAPIYCQIYEFYQFGDKTNTIKLKTGHYNGKQQLCRTGHTYRNY